MSMEIITFYRCRNTSARCTWKPKTPDQMQAFPYSFFALMNNSE